ncbi:MAG: hydrogenase formation protein HypD, partial [Leptospiraceae bacterium]|nr:hydrogenase formation protein HypD [Leptospiraceae bacterium]
MDMLQEFRKSEYSKALINQIHKQQTEEKFTIMEVCGGHTAAILKYGIKDLLPESIELISGPGCPVCVTTSDFIDKGIELSHIEEVIVSSYGDVLRVPGSKSNLLKEKNAGRDIRICYSTLDAVEIAKQNPDKTIVFLALGFETTTPMTAIALKRARESRLTNFFILSGHKTMPEPMKIIASDPESRIEAFLLPGHVTTITGTGIYKNLSRDYHKFCSVSGFEPVDILHAILSLLEQRKKQDYSIQNKYSRAVSEEGNLKARELIKEVFEEVDVAWKGFGLIPKSGMGLRREWKQYD